MMSMDPYSAQEESGEKDITTPSTVEVYNPAGAHGTSYLDITWDGRFQRFLFARFSQWLNSGALSRP